MAPAAEAVNNNNWLSFSLSPMDMFAHSHHPSSSPHILPSPFTSHQYFLDSFYSPEWGSHHQHHKASEGGEQATMGLMYTEYMVDHHPLDNNNNNSNNNNNNNNSVKKVSDTFGQRTSIYRGVTRHRWTGRYEAHLWDNSCRREGQARTGRQGVVSWIVHHYTIPR